MSNWGGKREGSGRKALSTKDVKVRLTSEQHKTLKALGGSEWLQNQIDSNKSFAGRRLVIEYDFSKVYFATDDEIEQLRIGFQDKAIQKVLLVRPHRMRRNVDSE